MTLSFDWSKEAEIQWNDRALDWSARSVNMWETGSRKDIVPLITSYFKKGSKVLDIGCGDGYGSYKLYEEGYDVTGIDLSSEMIALAKQKRGLEPIRFLQGNVNELPFNNQTFDGVMVITVLEWTENPLHALREIKRIVKKDGLICIGMLGPTAGPRENGYSRLYGEKTISHTIMPWELSRLASEQNLAYLDGYGVYKKEVIENNLEGLPIHLKQALSFMWIHMFQKVGD
ncbi:class I SAM-dependent methyltransferase [Oceanobacillus senegalensis]|uniref:class I SAM-dependent methyltransferase n=1 Tax=Oceanobacillus senegalensis TaxID=1936063 RepID=UPI000A3062D3|nr:class I SAM-dependent methyltransferase [Oceanobacillus senegalensis]